MKNKFNLTLIALPWLPLVLTIAWIVAYYYDLVVVSILCLVAIAVSIVVWVAYLTVTAFKSRDRKILVKQLAQTCLAVAFPILVIPNIRAIDFACTYAVVKIMEPRLLQQVQQSPNQTFRYLRVSFGHIAANGRWVIYDESAQVLLAPHKRSVEWWATTKEDKEADVACFTDARPMYSHFFIRYSGCI